MPRQLKEINNFNLGIILNASEKDTPEDAASFSLNINPLSENGILDAINADKLIVDIAGNFTRLANPITWGENNNKDVIANYNDSNIIVEDYRVFNNKNIVEFQFTGTKGKKEKLTCWDIEPYFEKSVSHTTPLIFKPSTAFLTSESTALTGTKDYITYSENANDYGAATTITAANGEAANGVTEGQYITLISTDGTTKNYVITDTNDSGVATGTVLTTSSVIGGGSDTLGSETNLTEGVAVGINKSSAEQWDILDQLEDAIEHSNGHNGAIVVTGLNATSENESQSMTVTQAVGGDAGNTRIVSSLGNPATQVITIANSHTDSEGYFRGGFSMDTYFEVGDYMSFAETDGNPAFTGASDFEVVQINEIDTVNERIYLTRNCFGTKSTPLAASGTYWIYSNRITIDSVQQRTHKGTTKTYGWSDYSGNHIGGPGYHNVEVDNIVTRRKNGRFDLDSAVRTIVFSNTNKTVTFDVGLLSSNDLAFVEGDVVTFYASGAYGSFPNHGFSATIVKKEYIGADSVLVWTLDTAPTDETTANADNDYYVESNLIKNFTFHHSQDTAAQDTGTDKAYKVNDWTHYSYHIDTVLDPDGMNNYYKTSTTTDVAKVSSGGYWEDTNIHGSAVEENYYPFTDNDINIKIISGFARLNPALEVALEALVTDNTIIMISRVHLNVSKHDILRIDNEYMLVEKVIDSRILVQRGYYDTVISTHSASTIVYKGVNNSIRQEISKDKLVRGQ